MKRVKSTVKKRKSGTRIHRFRYPDYTDNFLAHVHEVEQYRIQETRLELDYLRVAFNV